MHGQVARVEAPAGIPRPVVWLGWYRGSPVQLGPDKDLLNSVANDVRAGLEGWQAYLRNEEQPDLGTPPVLGRTPGDGLWHYSFDEEQTRRVGAVLRAIAR